MKVGIDAVGIERIAIAVRRSGPGFLDKAYTEAELAYCAGSAERLAGRWAAKEAGVKRFDGTGNRFPRRRIEGLPNARGPPVLNLLGETSGADDDLSITHPPGLGPTAPTLTPTRL